LFQLFNHLQALRRHHEVRPQFLLLTVMPVLFQTAQEMHFCAVSSRLEDLTEDPHEEVWPEVIPS
jgi:hypothetical protein